MSFVKNTFSQLQVSLNPDCTPIIMALPDEAREKLSEQMGDSITHFMHETNRLPDDIVAFMRKLASLHPPGAVCSNYIAHDTLFVYVDYPELNGSQFIYLHTKRTQ